MSNETTKEATDANVPSVMYLVTFLAVGGILAIRITNGKELTWMEIALFAIGVLPWFSSFMDSFKFGKDGFEAVFKKELDKAKEEIKAEVKEKTEKIVEETATKINEITETTTAKINEATEATTAKIDEVKQSSEINQSLGAFGSGGKAAVAIKEYKEKVLAEAENTADPQKGKWGGSEEDKVTHRKLTVRVEEIPGNDYFRRIILRVGSTNPAKYPLTDTVTFHLHPTFAKPIIEVRPTDNAAEIKLVAYGAFTVGAETDNGQTKLELDIAKAYFGSDDPFFNR
jgi:hypothetical protein